MNDLFFVFDVESLGLYGASFAVGWVVCDMQKELEADYLAFNPDFCARYEFCAQDYQWVQEHVLPNLEFNRVVMMDLLRGFTERWGYWKGKGATMAADCPYPVEYRFLRACYDFDDLTGMTEELSPYPLIDVASILLAKGKDPIGTYPRLDAELPIHHPLNDARQSARLLRECLK